MDTAITLGKRVLVDQQLLGLLLSADEQGQDKNPFNNISKLQVMVSKSKNPRNIKWVFNSVPLELISPCPERSTPRFDGWRNGHLEESMLTWRGLRDGLGGRGTCDMFIAILEFKEYLFTKYVPSRGFPIFPSPPC